MRQPASGRDQTRVVAFPVQLAFGDGPKDSWRVTGLDAKGAAELEVSVSGQQLAVAIRGTGSWANRVLGGIWIDLDAPQPLVGTKGYPGDCVVELLANERKRRRGLYRVVEVARRHPLTQCTVRDVGAFFRVFDLAHEWLEQNLDKAARSIALRFADEDAWFVYGLAHGDKTGRLAQLLDGCPGMLAFCRILQDRCSDAAKEVIDHVITGRRVRLALDTAIDAWAAEHPGLGAEARWAQRIKIRRACSRVPGWQLWTPPPVSFIPSDIPPRTDSKRNVNWYRGISETVRVTDYLQPCPVLRRAFCRSLSCRCADMHADFSVDRLCRRDIADLAAHVHRTRRLLSRKTDHSRLLSDYHRWLDELAERHELPNPS